MSRSRFGALLLALVLCAASLTAQGGHDADHHEIRKDKSTAATTDLRAAIWRETGPVAYLNLSFGAGGNADTPSAPFTFVSEDTTGTTPKFEITDGHGAPWKVKLGEEAQPEVAATRLLWAMGYFVDEDYYLGELTVNGLPKLHRGAEFVSSGGVVRGARLERKLGDVEKLETWDWFENPFTGTKELNGLRVLMALLNNWDLKEINNAIYKVGDERHYVVADLGASLGSTGNRVTRSKSTPKDYAEAKFIDKATPEFVDFVFDSRPFFLSAAINLSKYQTRAHMEDIARRVPRADVQWIGDRLSMLSDAQIHDAFLAAGYSPYEVEVYAGALKKRIAELIAA